ncbi:MULTISPECIES: DUF4440 domain-containing protein [Acinetobacter]|uniref:DUF4440 domain-containing protein n=1 Tax=Acinetobacter piscicola TaxID=2006115 RepID=A0A4Q4H0W5_9GAMM|nr:MULTISPECIES: DUF4440 domain-containing protein [Acinetobacter]MDM1759163.1 DUF4440 domain-containing protein [Acinetobacter sp. 256-1]MDM1760222.1 DUF4440 domain-containing protein [Acinetobacter sp. 251-1]QOW46685.1 DUF4440 domain-containing protein [Acinetobacter piscicola]RYL27553.1 DUF4440 domain-containing protein [Acinetobacter piscicola]
MALSATQAIESIHTMHVLIEKIFSGRHAEQDLAQLNQYFSEQFEMVGAAGKKFKFDEVKQLFANNQSKMPDIKIEIYDEEIISQSEHTIVLTYTEKHTKESGILIRRSCALIEEINGKMLWRYLQETFLS